MRFGKLVVLALAACTTASQLQAQTATKPRAAHAPAPVATAKPESVGFSAEGLAKFETGMHNLVDNKELAGMVTLVARHGKIVEEKNYGYADLASKKPMEKDTIVRIYSMSKPITGAAMMMLYDEGKWKPTDPISKFIPEFKDLQVFSGTGADGKPTTETPHHAPTMGELMSHSAGFTYGFFGSTPVDKIYQVSQPLSAPSLQEFINRVAKIPLLYQPGEGWVYSVSVDIQGYLVEKLSGKPFPEFLRQRIFEPLGMKDTGFFVPEAKLGRVATVYQRSASGLQPMPRDPEISKMPGLPSGGGGLYSTAEDYFRFAQMILNGGASNGMRLLAPGSVELMRTNHLSDEVKNANKFGIGLYHMQPGLGFGYDFAILEDPPKLGSPAGKGSFLWDGVAGTWFWIDPTNDVIGIGIIQQWLLSGGPEVENLSRTLVYQALVDSKK